MRYKRTSQRRIPCTYLPCTTNRSNSDKYQLFIKNVVIITTYQQLTSSTQTQSTSFQLQKRCTYLPCTTNSSNSDEYQLFIQNVVINTTISSIVVAEQLYWSTASISTLPLAVIEHLLRCSRDVMWLYIFAVHPKSRNLNSVCFSQSGDPFENPGSILILKISSF